MSSIEKFMNRLEAQGDSKMSTGLKLPDETAKQFLQVSDGDDAVSSNANFDNTYGMGSVFIDLDLLKITGALVPSNARSKIAEEYRVIKRPIIKNAFVGAAEKIENANIVMITSALPGEGKSFNAINLAMSVVMEMDYTVLLVEADVAKPAILKSLGIRKSKKGLVDYLMQDDARLQDYLLHTNIPKLTILPAGRNNPKFSELLSSRNMKKLVHELSCRYSDRLIIIDAPPLLVTHDAVTMSAYVGQVVLVIESGKTEHSVVKEAVNQLDQDQTIGVILNKSFRSSSKAAYGTYGSNA